MIRLETYGSLLSLFVALTILLTPSPGFAKVDLVSLPERDRVQLTIYNNADLTLVRETRRLTLRKGVNRLQFGWANTLIDPTSISLRALEHPAEVRLLDVTFPPRTKGVAVWNVQSDRSGEEAVEITFFASGLSWSAYYLATLSPDERSLGLEGYVRLTNQSGEDFANAQTRLLVGKIHLIDQIIDLAQREYPYATPIEIAIAQEVPAAAKELVIEAEELMLRAEATAELKRKEIVKEGLAEYFLFTIEGEETIPHGWSKRLPSFRKDEIPVVNLYRFEEESWGSQVMRFLSFVNDEEHGLGQAPLPDGPVKAFRRLDGAGHLCFVGSTTTRYIPKGGEIELALGPDKGVIVEPKLVKFSTDHYLFDSAGNIEGWDEIHTFNIQVENRRHLPIKVEIWRNFPTNSWELVNEGEYGSFEKIDLDTVKYTLQLPAHTNRSFTYKLTIHQGKRAQ